MAEAKLNREYALRIIGVGTLMMGMCVWSLFDGYVAWPRINMRMMQVRPALMATQLTAEAWIDKNETGRSPLNDAFLKKGYPTPAKLIKKLSELAIPDTAQNRIALLTAQPPHVTALFDRPIYSAHDLQTQFVQAVITFMLGAWAFGVVVVKSRKRYIADDYGLSGSGFGGRGCVPYEEIRVINWQKWDDKGIIVITLNSDVRYTLDGWHFAGMTELVEQIQRQRPDLCTEKLCPCTESNKS